MSNFYSIKGRDVPRVSAVLQHCEDRTGLRLWQERVGEEEANRIRDEAARLGTKIHKALELERTNEQRFVEFTSAFSDKEQGMLSNYAKLRESFNAKYIERSLHFFDKTTLQEYAGTPDAIGTITSDFFDRKGNKILSSGSKVVVDYKNYAKQKNIKFLTKSFLQLAAYYCAIHNVSTARLDGCVLATCSPRQLNLYYMDANLADIYVKLFLSCLEHYYSKQTFDWDGMLDYLGFEDMVVTDWSKIPERVYDAMQLEALNLKKAKRAKKPRDLKDFVLF